MLHDSALSSWECTWSVAVHLDYEVHLVHLSVPGSRVMKLHLDHGSTLGVLKCTWIVGVHLGLVHLDHLSALDHG